MADKYTLTTTVGSNGLTKSTMTDGNGVTTTVKKGNIRNALIKAGIDTEDSLSDTAKIASLTLSMACAMYSVFTEEMKAKLPTEVRGRIEYVVDKFTAAKTLADIQFEEMGTDLIDALIENQILIAKIVSEA